ncbi:MAG: hypothetical protein IJM18_06010, partial [Clostridia bacterium]|nr:hypothetical protein [Clostridia bacterium]
YKESLRLQNQRSAKSSGLDYEDVDDVALPDEEIPMGSLPDELAEEFEDEPEESPVKEEGEIEFSKGLSLEEMEEEEDNEPDDDLEEIDEGFTPAKRKHR